MSKLCGSLHKMFNNLMILINVPQDPESKDHSLFQAVKTLSTTVIKSYQEKGQTNDMLYLFS